MTDEQCAMLAGIERVHGNVVRVEPDDELMEMVAEQAGDSAILHCCRNCGIVFVIAEDGAVDAYEIR